MLKKKEYVSLLKTQKHHLRKTLSCCLIITLLISSLWIGWSFADCWSKCWR